MFTQIKGWEGEGALSKGWALKLMYIKLPIYLCFICRLDVIVLMQANPLLRALEGAGPEISTFGPKWHSLRSLPFQGTPLQLALIMDIVSIKIITSCVMYTIHTNNNFQKAESHGTQRHCY